MKKVIVAADLTPEIIATLPEQAGLQAYASANILLHTFDLRNNEPREESILKKAVGDNVVVILNKARRKPVLGTIVKVNKTTFKVQYKTSAILKPTTITVNEAGEVRGESSLFNATQVVNYVEGTFEQMVEVETYHRNIKSNDDAARLNLQKKLKELLPKVNNMSGEEAATLLKAIS